MVLFQSDFSQKMPNAFRKFLGFKRVIELRHRKWLTLEKGVEVYCYHSRHIDSALAVKSLGEIVLNVNDTELSQRDHKLLVRDLGAVDCMLNQFSIAGYDGSVNHEEKIPRLCENIINSMISDAMALKAKATIPFASFIYFSVEDNAYINTHMNSPRKVHNRFREAGLKLDVLCPGDVWNSGDFWDSEPALRRYDEIYANIDKLPIDPIDSKSLEEIIGVFQERAAQLRRHFPAVLLKWIKPFTVEMPNLGKALKFSIASAQVEELPGRIDPDVVINSQPLWYMFKFPFGLQTLGVSARLRLLRNARNWLALRMLFSLNNAEIYLKTKYVFRRRFLSYIAIRGVDLAIQLVYRLRRAAYGG